MYVPSRIRHFAASVRREDGIALPTALFAMIATFALASAAILSSVDAQKGSNRDNHSKNAIAAADAGASVALLRLNRFANSLSASNPCVGPGGEPQSATGGWCPPTEVETVGGSTYTYRMSAYTPDRELAVVAEGTADGVTRRVKVGFISYDGENVFADEDVVGQDNISLDGTPDIRTDVGTNGSIELSGDASICGDVRHGVGKEAPKPDCDGKITESNRDLPEVLPPDDIATSNDNCRLDGTCKVKTDVDSWSKKNGWNASTRTISVGQNSTLTMGGHDYFICKLSVGPGTLYMAADSHIRVFFDTPENCGMSAGDVRMEIGGGGAVIASGFKPSEGKYDVPSFYMLGSPDIPTQINLEGNSSTNELILYAPYSDIDLGGNSTWIGLMAGKSVHMHGTPKIESDPGISPPDIKYTSLWERTHYVECTGSNTTPPDSSC